MIKEKNDEASVITTPWDQIDGKKILDAMEKVNTLEKELLEEHHHHDGECGCGHEHHHHDHDVECGCGHEHHHHDHDEECGCGHEHHHDHDVECGCGHEHHHHDHDGECGCGHHHEHGHHHADDVFTSWGVETAHKFTEEELKDIVSKRASDKSFGDVLRAK